MCQSYGSGCYVLLISKSANQQDKEAVSKTLQPDSITTVADANVHYNQTEFRNPQTGEAKQPGQTVGTQPSESREIFKATSCPPTSPPFNIFAQRDTTLSLACGPSLSLDK